MRRVLVVGSGVTGASIAHLLLRRGFLQPPPPPPPLTTTGTAAAAFGGALLPRGSSSSSGDGGVVVEVWDKGARPGGRFTTFVDRKTGATCDMGCQVVDSEHSAQLGYPPDPSLHRLLRQEGLLQPLPWHHEEEEEGEGRGIPGGGGGDGQSSSTRRRQLLVGDADKGMAGITTFLTRGVEVRQSRRLARLDVRRGSSTDDEQAGGGVGVCRWRARSVCGVEEEFDAVVLTMPAPQILTDVDGDDGVFKSMLRESKVGEALAQVKYCSRYAVGLVYPPSTKVAPRTRGQGEEEVALMSLEHDKRPRRVEAAAAQIASSSSSSVAGGVAAAAPLPPVVVLVQSTTAFAHKYMDDHSDHKLTADEEKDKVTQLLMGAAGLPPSPPPIAIKFNKWKYSQGMDSGKGVDTRRLDKVKAKKDRQDGVYTSKHVRQMEKAMEGGAAAGGGGPVAAVKDGSKTAKKK